MTPQACIWLIAAASIAAVLFRPKGYPEAVWACLGAALLMLGGLLPGAQAWAAVLRGTDVYLFLTGMMLLAGLARQAGVFDWLASLAIRLAGGSASRLFTLVYLVGTAVTIFLSNDATAVVLTPAVAAGARKAKAKALPYLLICALIANAASFVLPISNPANLVVYGKHVPPLVPWLRTFLLLSLCSIAATYIALRWVCNADLTGNIEQGEESLTLSKQGQVAAWGIAGTGVALIAASAFGLDLGLPTFVSAMIAVLFTTRASSRKVLKIAEQISWSVLPLVAGLFIIIEALNHAGALLFVSDALTWCASLPRLTGSLLASFGIAALSNVMNNLPSGLLAGGALQANPEPSHIRDAVLIGIDLGPNLSVTGSLATLLWLIALRREGEKVGSWQFFKVGIEVVTPALLLATVAVAFLSN